MLKRRTWWLVLLAVVVGACGRSDAAAPEIDRYEVVPVQLDIVMKGAVNVSFQGRVKSTLIVRRIKDGQTGAMAAEILAVQPAEPVKYGDAAFLAGVVLTPFFGDGRYTIPAGSPQALLERAQKAGVTPEAASSLQVDWWSTGDIQTDPQTYMRRAKPCQAVTSKTGAVGRVTCPDVTDESGQHHFSLSFRWVAPAKAGPTTTSLPTETSTAP